MKASRMATALCLLAAGVCVGAAYVSARPAGEKKDVAPLRAGYVSASELMQKWKLWQVKSSEMNGRRQQAGLQLTGYRSALEQKKAAVTTAAGDDKARLEREVIDAQRTFEDAERTARADLDRDSGKILAEFSKRCHAEVAAMAKDLNLDVVYFCPITPLGLADKQLAPPQLDLYFRPPALMPAYLKNELDLTGELVERLNRAG